MSALLGVWKALLLAFFIGALIGGYTTQKFLSTFREAQTLRQDRANLTSRTAEATRREGVAASHEVDRESIDLRTEETGHELESYLDDRADVRALDLGPEWLCIADRAAGRAAPRCPSEPAAAVPGTGSATRQRSTGSAARVPAGDASVSTVREPSTTTGRSRDSAEKKQSVNHQKER